MYHIHIFEVLTLVNYLFVFFLLFFERKGSAGRFAWILALLLLPGLGTVLYIVFSGHFFTKTKKMDLAKKIIHDKTSEVIEAQLALIDSSAGNLPNPVMNEFSSLIDLNLHSGNARITFTNSCKTFLWGHDKFVALFKDIEQAKTNIFIQYFIIRNDKIGNEFMNLLCKKAKEGVEVKLLYDDFGCLFTSLWFFKKLDLAGGVSLPFFPIKFGNIFSINFRNHRKTVLIDNKIVYTGGFNVGDEYEGKKGYTWRDTHVRLTGNCVHEYMANFMVDWYSVATGKKAKFKDSTYDESKFFLDIKKINTKIINQIKNDVVGDSHIPTQIVSSGPDKSRGTEIKDAMIKLIMSAKKSVYIQTPYFTPDESFCSALKIAANSGIDIRIIVPGRWDKFYVRAAAFSFMMDFIPLGITFYKYPGFIHSKVIIVDGKVVTIGSCNIDTRSFDLLFETNIFFYDEVFATGHEKIFLDDQEKCEIYELAWLKSRNVIKRAWWSFCRLFSPIM